MDSAANASEEPFASSLPSARRASDNRSPKIQRGESDRRHDGDRRKADRRTGATPMFSRYSLLGGRRGSDRSLGNALNAYVDIYEPWVGVSLVSIGLLCAVDAVFTLLYIQRGGSEANPIMDFVIGRGPTTFILVKCGITNVGLLILCLHKNFRYVKAVIAFLLVVYSLLFVYHLYLASVAR